MREIEILERAERQGMRLRSEYERLRYDGRPSAHFWATEKRIKLHKQIDSQWIDSKEEVDAKEKILKATGKFYQLPCKTEGTDKTQLYRNPTHTKPKVDSDESED